MTTMPVWVITLKIARRCLKAIHPINESYNYPLCHRCKSPRFFDRNKYLRYNRTEGFCTPSSSYYLLELLLSHRTAF